MDSGHLTVVQSSMTLWVQTDRHASSLTLVQCCLACYKSLSMYSAWFSALSVPSGVPRPNCGWIEDKTSPTCVSFSQTLKNAFEISFILDWPIDMLICHDGCRYVCALSDLTIVKKNLINFYSAWFHRMLEGELHCPTIQNRLKSTSQEPWLRFIWGTFSQSVRLIGL